MKRFLVILLLCFPAFLLRAQGYDAALDRFAAITKECQRLKARLDEGKTIPERTLEGLLDELRAMQRDLQKARGSMTPAQKDRYQLILKCYREGKMVPESALQSAVSRTSEAWDEGESGLLSGRTRVVAGHPAGPGTRAFVMATGSWPLQGGLVVGFVLPSGWGTGVRFSGNGIYPKRTLSANSTGEADGGFIWATGAVRHSRLAGTIDLVWCPSRPGPVSAGLYGGAGYGFDRTFWQTSGGDWALIQDLSVAGPAFDLGILCFRRHLAVSLGLTTLSFRTLSGTVGVGYRF